MIFGGDSLIHGCGFLSTDAPSAKSSELLSDMELLSRPADTGLLALEKY